MSNLIVDCSAVLDSCGSIFASGAMIFNSTFQNVRTSSGLFSVPVKLQNVTFLNLSSTGAVQPANVVENVQFVNSTVNGGFLCALNNCSFSGFNAAVSGQLFQTASNVTIRNGKISAGIVSGASTNLSMFETSVSGQSLFAAASAVVNFSAQGSDFSVAGAGTGLAVSGFSAENCLFSLASGADFRAALFAGQVSAQKVTLAGTAFALDAQAAFFSVADTLQAGNSILLDSVEVRAEQSQPLQIDLLCRFLGGNLGQVQINHFQITRTAPLNFSVVGTAQGAAIDSLIITNSHVKVQTLTVPQQAYMAVINVMNTSTLSNSVLDVKMDIVVSQVLVNFFNQSCLIQSANTSHVSNVAINCRLNIRLLTPQNGEQLTLAGFAVYANASQFENSYINYDAVTTNMDLFNLIAKSATNSSFSSIQTLGSLEMNTGSYSATISNFFSLTAPVLTDVTSVITKFVQVSPGVQCGTTGKLYVALTCFPIQTFTLPATLPDVRTSPVVAPVTNTFFATVQFTQFPQLPVTTCKDVFCCAGSGMTGSMVSTRTTGCFITYLSAAPVTRAAIMNSEINQAVSQQSVTVDGVTILLCPLCYEVISGACALAPQCQPSASGYLSIASESRVVSPAICPAVPLVSNCLATGPSCVTGRCGAGCSMYAVAAPCQVCPDCPVCPVCPTCPVVPICPVCPLCPVTASRDPFVYSLIAALIVILFLIVVIAVICCKFEFTDKKLTRTQAKLVQEEENNEKASKVINQDEYVRSQRPETTLSMLKQDNLNNQLMRSDVRSQVGQIKTGKPPRQGSSLDMTTYKKGLISQKKQKDLETGDGLIQILQKNKDKFKDEILSQTSHMIDDNGPQNLAKNTNKSKQQKDGKDNKSGLLGDDKSQKSGKLSNADVKEEAKEVKSQTLSQKQAFLDKVNTDQLKKKPRVKLELMSSNASSTVFDAENDDKWKMTQTKMTIKNDEVQRIYTGEELQTDSNLVGIMNRNQKKK